MLPEYGDTIHVLNRYKCYPIASFPYHNSRYWQWLGPRQGMRKITVEVTMSLSLCRTWTASAQAVPAPFSPALCAEPRAAMSSVAASTRPAMKSTKRSTLFSTLAASSEAR